MSLTDQLTAGIQQHADAAAFYQAEGQSIAAAKTEMLNSATAKEEELQQQLDDFVQRAGSEIAENMGARGALIPFMTEGGQVSWFWGIQKFQIEDWRPDDALGTGTHPAFIHNSGEYDMLFIGAYMATMKNGEIVCQPNQQPRTGRTQDEEIAECAGTQITGIPANSHRLMSIWDWSAVNHWIMANVAAGGSEPLGNTSYGRSHSQAHIAGNGVSWTKTGTMGPTANHNRQSHGISDWVGNCWDRIMGMDILDGAINLSANNDPANLAAPAATGSAFTSGRAVDVSAQALKTALIEPLATGNLSGSFWINKTGSRAPLVGGSWSNQANAGPVAVNLRYAASRRPGSIGFRPAFVI